MGTSKRYAHVVDARMDERILRQIAESGPLQNLTAEELELDRMALAVDPFPKPVRARVRFGNTPVQVNAVAVRWTTQAVGVEFTIGGKTYRCWVWRGAVTDRDD
ncbi:hypothetical protein OHB93_02250 [Microbacterium sp. No. 7]|uniref:hypothetical protein n=1 Tax=Microbacterium sp. No. 7 TaxID=1714373 RepID=UPI00300B859F